MLPHILIALVVIAAVLYGGKFFAKANPATMAKLMKQAGGVASLAAAGFLLLRGRVDVAAGLAGLGLWLLGLSSGPSWASGLFRSSSAKGKVSKVRSAMIEMELDVETGNMSGTVIAGQRAGQKLEELTRPDCEALYTVCQRDDPDGARLLEAYLDRRFPGWRPAVDGDADARQSRDRRSGAMPEDEAYEILGLAKTASREDITAAHRSLMKKLHPDHGGTTRLAAQINEAKEVLMRRHH
jgi:hypothetical protein